MDEEAKKLRRRQRTNIIVARFIPAFLTAIVAYASWVFVSQLCVDYLLTTPANAGVEPRIVVGIALPIVYFFLLILMAACYLRLLQIVTFDPGYIAQRSTAEKGLEKDAHAKDTQKLMRSCASTNIVGEHGPMRLDYEAILTGQIIPPPGIEEFYSKDAFVCDKTGLPLWCHTCGIFKPDRCHHSRDVGRCVTKMDHFCPWVGGMVSETGYKFFVQFNFYASVFSLYAMIVMAYFIAEAEMKTGYVGNVHWVIVLALGGFFAIFTFGLLMTSLSHIVRNLTTVEQIDTGHRTMHLAVLLPPELQSSSILPPPPAALRTETPPSTRSGDSARPLTSEIDDPLHHNYFSNEQSTRSRSRKHSRDDLATSIWQGTITYPLSATSDHSAVAVGERRTFAILKTPPGMNPWDLGAVANLLSVFGYSAHQWFLPLRRSPCNDHSSHISRYAFGWEFERLLADARLVQPPIYAQEAPGSSVSRGQRKRKRKLAEGWQNGERPDGWILEKEARRARRQLREHTTDTADG